VNFQNEIDGLLKNAGNFENRMALLGILIGANHKAFNKTYSTSRTSHQIVRHVKRAARISRQAAILGESCSGCRVIVFKPVQLSGQISERSADQIDDRCLFPKQYAAHAAPAPPKPKTLKAHPQVAY
jgi:hypothetical protein